MIHREKNPPMTIKEIKIGIKESEENMHEYYVAYYTEDGKKVAETVWAKSPQDAREIIQSRPNFGYFTESPKRVD